MTVAQKHYPVIYILGMGEAHGDSFWSSAWQTRRLGETLCRGRSPQFVIRFFFFLTRFSACNFWLPFLT